MPLPVTKKTLLWLRKAVFCTRCVRNVLTLTAGHNSGSITCTNTLKNDRWLNGFSDVIANIFGIRH